MTLCPGVIQVGSESGVPCTVVYPLRKCSVYLPCTTPFLEGIGEAGVLVFKNLSQGREAPTRSCHMWGLLWTRSPLSYPEPPHRASSLNWQMFGHAEVGTGDLQLEQVTAFL